MYDKQHIAVLALLFHRLAESFDHIYSKTDGEAKYFLNITIQVKEEPADGKQ